MMFDNKLKPLTFDSHIKNMTGLDMVVGALPNTIHGPVKYRI